MHWYRYVTYFVAGSFFANAIPHFTYGVSGRQFPTPCTMPPGKGMSSPAANVLWGSLNLVIAFRLLRRMRVFNGAHSWRDFDACAEQAIVHMCERKYPWSPRWVTPLTAVT